MKIDNFFAELKRRNVYEVALRIIADAWEQYCESSGIQVVNFASCDRT